MELLMEKKGHEKAEKFAKEIEDENRNNYIRIFIN